MPARPNFHLASLSLSLSLSKTRTKTLEALAFDYSAPPFDALTAGNDRLCGLLDAGDDDVCPLGPALLDRRLVDEHTIRLRHRCLGIESLTV